MVECKANMAKSSRETPQGNVFLSWSGERSSYVAKFFYGWLHKVIQRANPWFSEVDIDKGTVGIDEIRKALNGMQVGIFFLTPENRESVWMPYEAGSLLNEVNDKSRVCTYLLGGLQIQHVRGPFGMFQHTRPDREDTRQLVHTINKVLDGPALSDSILNDVFDKWWPELASHLEGMPKDEGNAKPLPSQEEMIAEILEFSRATANSRKQAEWLDQLAADNKDFFPIFFQFLKGLNVPQLLSQALPTPEPQPPPPREPICTFCVRLTGDDVIKRVEGTVVAETAIGQVVVFIGNEIAGKFESVESWWRESKTLPAH
jgi:hypothetical protein